MAKPQRPRGAIKGKDAHGMLQDSLGVDPATDSAILFWADWRRRLLRSDRLRRRGVPNPTWSSSWKQLRGKPLPPLYLETDKKGRPSENELDRANAFLLKAHPCLADSDLYFAMLEALFCLDQPEAIRFPLPKLWTTNPNLAQSNRASVRDRARRRIDRAIQRIVSETVLELQCAGTRIERSRERPNVHHRQQ